MDFNDGKKKVIKPLLFKCANPDCKTFVPPQDLFTTSEHKLRIAGKCPTCHEGIWWEIPLLELLLVCPMPERTESPMLTTRAEADRIVAEDNKFLAALNITYPPSEDNNESQ